MDRTNNPVVLIKVNEDEEQDFDCFIQNKKIIVPASSETVADPTIQEDVGILEDTEADENQLEKVAAQLVGTMWMACLYLQQTRKQR